MFSMVTCAHVCLLMFMRLVRPRAAALRIPHAWHVFGPEHLSPWAAGSSRPGPARPLAHTNRIHMLRPSLPRFIGIQQTGCRTVFAFFLHAVIPQRHVAWSTWGLDLLVNLTGETLNCISCSFDTRQGSLAKRTRAGRQENDIACMDKWF